MNINFLSKSVQSNSVNQTSFKNTTKTNYQYNLGKDIFVKSTNNVSFGSINKTKYDSFQEDMTSYFMNAEELSPKEIEKLIIK